jgi:hypothetical protein
MPVTKYHESATRDFNIYLQIDYAFGQTQKPFFKRRMDEIKAQQLKAWMARGGYMTGWSLYDLGESYTEDMLLAELHKRIPFKSGVLFSQRIRGETRWIGQDPKFSYRYRYRIMFEKEFTAGRTAIIPYINAEPFWDSRYSKVVRTRVIGGATFSRDPLVALEGNVTYQYDETYNTPNLFALNVILHLFFERHHTNKATDTN